MLKNIRKLMLKMGFAVIFLTACGNQGGAPVEQGPIEVSVAEVVYEKVTEWDEFTGRLQAPLSVKLMPRVSGYIEHLNFTEGSLVQKGDLLFQIDPRPFSAEVSRLKAELESANSAAILADNEYSRAEKLSQQQAISIEVLDNRLANKRQAKAKHDSVKSALERAELELSFTKVKAPISGRVSLAEVTVGNYVTAGQTLLTNLVSTEIMYAYFDVDEQTFLKYRHLAKSGHRVDTREVGANPVYMALATDDEFRHVGSIDFVDNRVDSQTGTIRLRASFANADNQLLPGLFAKVRLAGSATYDGVLIDEKAIGTDLNNKFVLLVNESNQLEYRAIELGEKLDGLRLVRRGLNPSDRIVVNGLQRVRPGMQIQPKLVEMASYEQLAELRSAQELLDQTTRSLTVQTDKIASEAKTGTSENQG
ncbi:efflux RND transporter periplasmic adaptor subunit [Shewanella zhangzhouensis]|uniref:efflux RND transporter periplasmic adaptor subunit n=1 Tax=Shewanella zhangzhouensis TaxID=2864213 RepID=UPI001C65A823|nr:efflux RND transporter periplasmic adaptor subunit [Shewanella zhangzhouensis]QYK07005.1 efflux RND transporter periplasmic adaptor subunit [Shewanella zhangzhouensis]